MAFLGVVEKYILGGHWSCIGRHELPDGAKGGGGATKNKTNYTITTNTQTSDGANGGRGWSQKRMLIKHHNTVGQRSDNHTTH